MWRKCRSGSLTLDTELADPAGICMMSIVSIVSMIILLVLYQIVLYQIVYDILCTEITKFRGSYCMMVLRAPRG